MKRIYNLMLIGFIFTSSYAQITAPLLIENYKFIKLEADTICLSEYLDSYYKVLDSVNSKVINILHIGDSHIQGDMLTSWIRGKLGQLYGYGGHGFMFPYQAAHTNGHLAYTTQSLQRWEVNKVTLPICPNTNGIAGISISSANINASIHLSIKKTGDSLILDNRIKDIYIYHNKKNPGFWLQLTDNVYSKEYSFIQPNITNDTMGTLLQLDTLTSDIVLQNTNETQIGSETIYYGFVTYNGKPGIVYNSIGVNGAEFRHFTCNPLFFKQLNILNPKLIILSFGTNEAQDWKRTDDEIISQIQTCIDSLRRYIPGVSILLTTPLESFRKARKLNPHIKRVRNCLIQAAHTQQCAYWDLYYIAGGYGSSYKWIRNKLFSRDKVHNSLLGYQIQGELLFRALTRKYNK